MVVSLRTPGGGDGVSTISGSQQVGRQAGRQTVVRLRLEGCLMGNKTA